MKLKNEKISIKTHNFKEMKKIIIALALGTMFGCSSTQTCVQVSPVAKRTKDGKHVYFKNDETGSMVYRMWSKGIFGYETQPHLVGKWRFIFIPSVTSEVSITSQTSNSTVLNR
jgi:hypothetical protein